MLFSLSQSLDSLDGTRDKFARDKWERGWMIKLIFQLTKYLGQRGDRGGFASQYPFTY